MKPKNRVSLVACIAFFLLIHAHALFADAQVESKNNPVSSENNLSFELRYNSWTALSLVNLGSYSLGNPRLTADSLGFELGYTRKRKRIEQRFLLTGLLPGKIDFDDGFGNNRTLNRDSSQFWEMTAQYHFLWYVVDKPKFSLGLGFLLSENFNRLQLDYLSIGKTSYWNLNSGIGKVDTVQYAITPKIKVRLDLLNVWYLPWVSFGKLTRPTLEENVNNFVFTSTLSISLGLELNKKSVIVLGYSRHETLELGMRAGGPYFSLSDYPEETTRFSGTNRYFVRWQIKLGKGE